MRVKVRLGGSRKKSIGNSSIVHTTRSQKDEEEEVATRDGRMKRKGRKRSRILGKASKAALL